MAKAAAAGVRSRPPAPPNSNTPQPGADQSIILNGTDRDGYWMQADGTPVATTRAVTMDATVVGNPNAWNALARPSARAGEAMLSSTSAA